MAIDNLKIDINDVLGYLGHKGQIVDETTNILIEQCIEEIRDGFQGKYVYQIYNIKYGKDIELLNTPVKLTGESISSHLKGCTQCVLMAVTLGSHIDKMIMNYMVEHITKGIIFDACATAFVEVLCDFVEDEVKKEINKDQSLTTRFSPGYGDLPIAMQPEILNVLDVYRKIGLSVNENFILIPRKSVTAIIGIGSNIEEQNKRVGCAKCIKYGTCGIRKEGKYCGI